VKNWFQGCFAFKFNLYRYNLAARDATMQHRMVSAGVPEMCAQLCAWTDAIDAGTTDTNNHSSGSAPPPSLRLRALGLLQCLFEGKQLSAAAVPRLRVLLVDAALSLCRGGDRATLEGVAREGYPDMPAPADADPFRLELAGMRALTRVTAVLGAKELVAERGALDMAAALLTAGYYDSAEGEGDVPFPAGSAAGVTARSGIARSPAVREAAVVCLRNLSSSKPLMAGIGRRALYLMLRMNLDRKLPKVQRVHAAAVLHNIHKEPANRTRFYKAELRYKAAGTERTKKSGKAPRAPKVDPLTKARGKSARGARPTTAAAARPTATGGLGMMYWGGSGGYGSDGYGSGPEPEESIIAEKENAEGERRAAAAGWVLKNKQPVAPILDLDDEDRLELRHTDQVHRQHGEHLMRWMGEVFPVKPSKNDNLQRTGGGGGGGDDEGFLPNIGSGGGGGNLGASGRRPASAYSRPGSAFEHKGKSSYAASKKKQQNANERDADVKLQRRMCRPVNRIWGTVPGEGLPDTGAGGLRQGNRRWGPVVHEYVQVDAEMFLTPGSDDLLTAARPASTARRLNEAALQTAEAASADAIGIGGGFMLRPPEAMRGRPARVPAPLMLPAPPLEREKSGRSRSPPPREDQAPPITKIMPAARQRVQSARGAPGSSSSGYGGGGSAAGRPASGKSAPPLSRPATARVYGTAAAQPGTAKSSAASASTSFSSRPGTGRVASGGRQPRSSSHGAASSGGGAGAGGGDAAAADHAKAGGTIAEENDAAGNVGHFGIEKDVEEEEPDLDATEVDRRMALKLVMAHGGGDGGDAPSGGAAAARHRINFEDRPENLLKVRAGKALRFCAWKHVDGSRVHEDLPSYPLPNGLRGHFYDRGSETIDEVTAPAAAPPDRPVTLRGLIQCELPPALVLLELSIPSEDFGISSMRPTPRLPRDPETHTLDVGENPKFFGDLQDHPPRFESTVETVYQHEYTEEKVAERPPWDIDKSVFAPRRRESDGKDYYNHARVENKQFERDWKRAMEKEQFKKFVYSSAKDAAEADGKEMPMKGKELNEIKATFAKHHSELSRAFLYFCLLGSGDDVFDMQLNEYKDFLDACGIPDSDSERCKQSDLDTLFITTNFAAPSASKNSDKGTGMNSKDNNLNSLTRFEFMRIIVRIAVAKYGMGASESGWDVSDAVSRLVEQNILGSLPPVVRASLPGAHGEEYRNQRLYCEEMDILYSLHLKTLQALYSRYRLPVTGKKRPTQLGLDGWTQLFCDAALIDGDLHDFTRREVKLCFVMARMTAVDEMSTRKNETLTFVDFLDALGRAAELINLPTHKEVTRVGFTDILHYQKVASGVEQARIPRRESTAFEAVKTRRLHVKVDSLLQLIFRKLDFDPSVKNYVYEEKRFRKRLAVIDQKLGF
jgi:hypothetical protein